MAENTLHFGDKLKILRDNIGETVDLIYLDPPFNSSPLQRALSFPKRPRIARGKERVEEQLALGDDVAF